MDPGVPQIDTVDQAVAVIGSTRLWAVCAVKKNTRWETFWKSVQKKLSG